MRKGFTLIELLIVMVVVAILVTISVPKYKAAMEKTRGLEGITNIKLMGDFLNARYVAQGNNYCPNGNCNDLSKIMGDADLAHNTYFGAFSVSSKSSEAVTFSTSRDSGNYRLEGQVSGGDTLDIYCFPTSGSSVGKAACLGFGGEPSGGGYKINQ